MFGQIPDITGNDKQDVQNLRDAVIAMRRELNDMLYHLDSENIAELNATIIRTSAFGARIELKANGIISYNNSNRLHGLVFDPAAAYANFKLYYNNIKYFEIERMSDASGLLISAFGENILGFNYPFKIVNPRGEWDFSSAAGIYGLSSFGYVRQIDLDEAIHQHIIDYHT